METYRNYVRKLASEHYVYCEVVDDVYDPDESVELGIFETETICNEKGGQWAVLDGTEAYLGTLDMDDSETIDIVREALGYPTDEEDEWENGTLQDEEIEIAWMNGIDLSRR